MNTILKILVILLAIIYLIIVVPVKANAPLRDIPEWERAADPLFEKIADCESDFDLEAKNPTSSAKGEFQFVNKTWKYYGMKLWGTEFETKNVLSADNRELAWYVYTHYGTRDWEADPKSYNCWKVEIPNATHKGIHKNR